ncbi:AarF/ABC1/UbiB kinase family protein [Marivibrio halodurans]|uniref:AarF/ABC1/UbiB kinase family protein n=1 Tax=Marivibrio halodurans TaxID=2039722 RepID=A0A8J7S6V6_9PROT|nr:AarF/ABC1/UbiB kinase family protein [Marivibrio halodurans]MBP5856672.1 AarF/ABC1/UbiB kinase family protein [Marivibrio halodurans]
MTDENTFYGQAKRYARVGTAMAGIGARLGASRYLGRTLDNSKYAAELTQALGGLKGPVMKVAQILATIPDAIPTEYADELRQLQTNAPPMGFPFVRRRMRGELGEKWQTRFKRFERDAAHAASLGQVHKAWLEDDTPVACKLQYPEMGSAIESDLKQLKLIFSIYKRYDDAISTRRIYEELSERLREELDYEREARAIALYDLMLADVPEVTVPTTVPDLCTKRLLTMHWLSGRPLMDFRDAEPETRNAIARSMFKAWYTPFYYYGVIHGDPHMGNYQVRDDFGINLLDFGCIRIFPARFVEGVIELYHALDQDDMERAVYAYECWGFERIDHDLLEILNIWARFLYKPLMQDSVQRIQDQESGRYGAEVAAKVHKELKRVGGVEPPREFVLMDRAAIGLGSVFMHLRAEINWHRMFHDLIADFDPKRLEARQAEALRTVGLSS